MHFFSFLFFFPLVESPTHDLQVSINNGLLNNTLLRRICYHALGLKMADHFLELSESDMKNKFGDQMIKQ